MIDILSIIYLFDSGIHADMSPLSGKNEQHWSVREFELRSSATNISQSIAVATALKWRHNECNGVSNNRHLECLLNCLFRSRSKDTSKLRAAGLCAGNSPVTGDFPHKGPVTRKMFPFDYVIMRYPFGHDRPICWYHVWKNHLCMTFLDVFVPISF